MQPVKIADSCVYCCRFYIMNLPKRGLSFSRITYHANVTQCLGGLDPPQPWYIVVAAPTGSVVDYPKQQQLTAFKVPHGMAIKFKQGTWHAGQCCGHQVLDEPCPCESRPH